MNTVLQCLEQENITLKLKKFGFGMEDCMYLGHRVGKGGVPPDQSKIQAVTKMERPHTKKEIRIFWE